MGQNIYEYTHPCDHDEIREILSSKTQESSSTDERKSFFIRLKCTLTSKGRSVNLKSATYKVRISQLILYNHKYDTCLILFLGYTCKRSHNA